MFYLTSIYNSLSFSNSQFFFKKSRKGLSIPVYVFDYTKPDTRELYELVTILKYQLLLEESLESSRTTPSCYLELFSYIHSPSIATLFMKTFYSKEIVNSRMSDFIFIKFFPDRAWVFGHNSVFFKMYISRILYKKNIKKLIEKLYIVKMFDIPN